MTATSPEESIAHLLPQFSCPQQPQQSSSSSPMKTNAGRSISKPSKDARKEPHEAAEVVFGGVLGFAIGKVKQDVSYDAEDGEPHQGMSDASRALAVAHGVVPAAKSFSSRLSAGQ